MKIDTAKAKIDKILNFSKVMYLATVNNNGEPSIRQMSFIYLENKIYFQTDKNFEKVKDLTSNLAVALGIGAYSFKGTAKLLGKPAENLKFVDAFKRVHPEAYKAYTNLSTEIVYEVSLNECKIWDSHDIDFDNKETITTVNLIKNTASTVYCVN